MFVNWFRIKVLLPDYYIIIYIIIYYSNTSLNSMITRENAITFCNVKALSFTSTIHCADRFIRYKKNYTLYGYFHP